MSITSRCTECGAESGGSGGIVHATTCSAISLTPKLNYGQQAPAIEIKFGSKAEQEAFHRKLAKGNGLVSYGSDTTSSVANPPKSPPTNSEDALEQLLHDYAAGVWSYGETIVAIRDWVRAETDMAKLQLLTELADKKILTIKTSEIRERLGIVIY